jgi:hypothetical protein
VVVVVVVPPGVVVVVCFFTSVCSAQPDILTGTSAAQIKQAIRRFIVVLIGYNGRNLHLRSCSSHASFPA